MVWLEEAGENLKVSKDRLAGVDSLQPKPKIEKNRHIPLKNRLEVLKRDHFRCVLCGASPAKDGNVTLHDDHVKPYSKGGSNQSANLQTLCHRCNWGKGSS